MAHALFCIGCYWFVFLLVSVPQFALENEMGG